MLAQSVAIWAFLTMILLCWVDNYFSAEQKKQLFAAELVTIMNAYAEADLDAMGNPGEVVLLTEDTFYKHVSSGKHFVKFYSSSCIFCNRMAPTLDNLAKELEQEPGVTISMIDCTKYRGPCQAFEVREYPMLLWIEDGKMIEMYEARCSLQQRFDFVKKFLEASKTQTLNTTKILQLN